MSIGRAVMPGGGPSNVGPRPSPKLRAAGGTFSSTTSRAPRLAGTPPTPGGTVGRWETPPAGAAGGCWAKAGAVSDVQAIVASVTPSTPDINDLAVISAASPRSYKLFVVRLSHKLLDNVRQGTSPRPAKTGAL